MTDSETSARPVFGLIMSDELRIEGLKAILCPENRCQIVQVTSHHARDLAGLALILLDSAATPFLHDAIDSLRRANPKTRIIVVGPAAAPEEISRIIAAGAKGFLPYTASAEELKMAVEVVLDGSVWAPRKVLANLLERADLERKAAAQEPHFTVREIEVLRLLVLGRSNREIAQGLHVDEGTIKAHLARLMRKAGVDNRTALSVKALQSRWPELYKE